MDSTNTKTIGTGLLNNLVPATTGYGEQGFPSAQRHLSRTDKDSQKLNKPRSGSYNLV
jgi:hypothetical protein